MSKLVAMNLAERLSEYAANIQYSDLDSDAVVEAKKRLLDSIGCALGAFNEPPAKAARRVIQKHYQGNAATMLGTRHKTTPDMAAFVNGLMVRYFDFNDSLRGSVTKESAHVSDNIAPCMAAAEYHRRSGRDLILAIVLAYEINIRLCDAASLGEWDHVNYYLVSMALAAGKLLGLSKEALAQAVNISLNSHIAMKQTRTGVISMWKSGAAANAGRNAIFSALIAKERITGPSPVFEGERGFFKQMTGPFELEVDRFGGKGRKFRIMDTSLKFYPAEGNAQTAISAAVEARKEVKNPAKDIVSVLVETTARGYKEIFTVLSDKERWAPTTKESADHCLPFIVGMALLKGRVDNDTYSRKYFRDPNILSFVKKIQVSEDKGLTAIYGERMPNRITVKTKDGRVIAKQVDFRKGSPTNPMTAEEIEQKFRSLTKRYLKERQADTILDLVLHMEKQRDLSPLLKSCSVQNGL
jgi:2-methylcitrate dehydratase